MVGADQHRRFSFDGDVGMCLPFSHRGRSRHTSGFEPFETFELAPQELISSTQPVGAEQQHDLHLQPTKGSSVFQWIQSSMGDAELAEAASR